MSDRNLTTRTRDVFGDVQKGTQCLICGRNVSDGRAKVCSDYCGNLRGAVMGMLNWPSVRRRIIERDNKMCQQCGFDYGREQEARGHIRGIIDEKTDDYPDGPRLDEIENIDDYDWDSHLEREMEVDRHRAELKDRYGDPFEVERGLEVDHITPVSKGGHPFDPANLQTLCTDCHEEKTAQEASERAQQRTPSRSELNESLFNYVASESGE